MPRRSNGTTNLPAKMIINARKNWKDLLELFVDLPDLSKT